VTGSTYDYGGKRNFRRQYDIAGGTGAKASSFERSLFKIEKNFKLANV